MNAVATLTNILNKGKPVRALSKFLGWQVKERGKK